MIIGNINNLQKLKQKDQMLLPLHPRNRTVQFLAWDAICPDTNVPSHLAHTTEVVERRKKMLLLGNSRHFTSSVMIIAGIFGPEMLEVLSALARSLN